MLQNVLKSLFDVLIVLAVTAPFLAWFMLAQRKREQATVSGFRKYGLWRSTHPLVHAGNAKDYFDSDLYLGDLSNVRGVVEWFKEELDRQRTLSGRIDRLTFIEKDSGGPVGALTLKDLLSLETKVPSAIVRLGRKGPALKIKMVHPHLASSSPGDFTTIEPKFRVNGEPEHVVIVSDVATTGTTILDTANRITEAGGQVEAAFVLYDREEGSGSNGVITAEEKLRQNKIRLVSMIRASEMANGNGEEHPKKNTRR
jgi:hypothetical protein